MNMTITIEQPDWRKVLAEVVGTFFFFFIGIGGTIVVGNLRLFSGTLYNIVANALGGQQGDALGSAFSSLGSSVGGNLNTLYVALAHGVALAIAISALGHVSGAHFNPAVTIGVMVARKISPMLALSYILGQLVGGLLACLSLVLILPDRIWRVVELGTPSVNSGVINPVQAILLEAILTFFLVIAVFGTAIDPRANKVGGFGIGLTVFVDMLIGGPLSGGMMNPARAIAPAIISGNWNDQYVWWIGPIIGAVVAALIYSYIFLPRGDEPLVVVPPITDQPVEPPISEPGMIG